MDAALAEAALSLVGTRFRLHGRVAETGLDCVGLVAAAMRGRDILPARHRGIRCAMSQSRIGWAMPNRAV